MRDANTCYMCGEAIKADDRFCGSCGHEAAVPTEPATRYCMSCGEETPLASRFCGSCGHEVTVFESSASAPPRDRTSPPPGQPEAQIPPPPVEAAPKKWYEWKRVWVIGLFLLLMIGANHQQPIGHGR